MGRRNRCIAPRVHERTNAFRRLLKGYVFAVLLTSALISGACELVQTVSADESTTAKPPKGCVVLLHGMGRTHRSMASMAHFLESAGYRTANIDYPSTDQPIETLAASAVSQGIAACRREAPGTPIHFVTHSLGGILVRYYLSGATVTELGRVVMLSPPNQGSEAAEALRELPFYQWLNGPAGQQLGTGKDSLPLSLGPVDFPLGIITGNENSVFDFWLDDMFPGENDGKVSVARAKVGGMADFLVLPHTHTFIMQEEDVMAQVAFFLKNGRFHHRTRTEDIE